MVALALNAWSTSPAMTVPRRDLGAVTLGGKIYAIAGRNNTAKGALPMASVEVYELATGTWSPVMAKRVKIQGWGCFFKTAFPYQ